MVCQDERMPTKRKSRFGRRSIGVVICLVGIVFGLPGHIDDARTWGEWIDMAEATYLGILLALIGLALFFDVEIKAAWKKLLPVESKEIPQTTPDPDKEAVRNNPSDGFVVTSPAPSISDPEPDWTIRLLFDYFSKEGVTWGNEYRKIEDYARLGKLTF